MLAKGVELSRGVLYKSFLLSCLESEGCLRNVTESKLAS